MISRVTENLYIGEYFNIVGQTPEETQSRFEQIQGLGIGHVLSLCSEGVEGCQIANEAEAFRASVHCMSGIDRAPFLCGNEQLQGLVHFRHVEILES